MSGEFWDSPKFDKQTALVATPYQTVHGNQGSDFFFCYSTPRYLDDPLLELDT